MNIQLESFTTLGRMLDPKHPTNLAIMVLTAFATIIAGLVGLLSGNSLTEALVTGFWSGFAVLFAWILGREVDPDNDLSAFVAAGLAFAASFIVSEAPYFLVILLTVQLARTVNRTVGPPAKLTDTAFIVILAGIVMLTGRWPMGLVAFVALMMDGRLSRPNTLHMGVSVLVLALILAYFVVGDVGKPGTLSTAGIAVSLSISAFWTLIVRTMDTVESVSDIGGIRLTLRRVQGAMVVVMLAGLVMLWYGDQGVTGMAPVWATLLGVGIYRIVKPMF